jgi:hypothetical protein
MKAVTSAAGVAATAAAGLTALALTGCGTGNGAQGPAATVTQTVTSTQTKPTNVPAPPVTQTVTAPAATVTQTAAAPASGQASSSGSGQGQVIARFNGSGTQNTGAFTTPANWALSWSYWGCPAGAANFIVTEYNSDGSLDLNGVSVNELGTGRGPVATHAYGDPGTHYLAVNTEGCDWSLVPVTV